MDICGILPVVSVKCVGELKRFCDSIKTILQIMVYHVQKVPIAEASVRECVWRVQAYRHIANYVGF